MALYEQCPKKRKIGTWNLILCQLPADSRLTELQLQKFEDLLSLQMFMNSSIEMRKLALQKILGEGNELVDLIEEIVSKMSFLSLIDDWTPSIGTSVLNTFYVIDINCPLRLETAVDFSALNLSKVNLHQIPKILHPAQIKLGFFSEDPISLGSYQLILSEPNVYIFCWKKSIPASSNRPMKYYSNIIFEDIVLQPVQQASHKLKKLELLVSNHSLMPFYEIEHLVLFVESFASLSDLSSIHHLSELRDTADNIIKNVDALKGDTMAMETQLTSITAKIIGVAYPEFQVNIESEDPAGASHNAFTPFYRSRRDITCYFRKKSESKSCASIIVCGESQAKVDDIIDNLVDHSEVDEVDDGIRYMNHDIKTINEFQLLANMEITATEIAKKQLCLSKRPLHKIEVYGGLLDYCNNIGTCYTLKMDFLMHTSRVKKQFRSKWSVTQAVTYLLDQLRYTS